MAQNSGADNPRVIVVETERLCLREFTPDDVDDLASWYGNPEVMYAWERTLTREAAAAKIEQQMARYAGDGLGLWAAELKSTHGLIGYGGLFYEETDDLRELGVGYLLDKPHWGQGYATEIARAMVTLGFQRTDAEKIVFLIRPMNARSRGVAERLNASVEGETMHAGFPHSIYVITRSQWLAKTEELNT